MKLQTMAIILAGAALLAGIFLFFLKRKEKFLPGKKKPAAEKVSLPPAADSSAGKNSLSRRQPEEMCRPERTMLLTYTTLLLKDVQHPVRLYRADLFRPVIIGRSRESGIVLEDPSVSRKHLRIYRTGALVYAENLSRTNKTLLNGKQLEEPRELMTGSRLQLGKSCFLVEID